MGAGVTTQLKADPKTGNTSYRVNILKTLFEQAEAKINHLDKLRQLNFSMSLLVFAGLIGFGLKQPSMTIKICVLFVLIFFVIILSSYDNNLHKYIHGWRMTRQEFVHAISTMINEPDSDLEIKTYYKEGELRAHTEDCKNIKNLLSYFKRARERPSQMRVVYYLMVRAAFLCVVPFLLITP